VESRLDWSRESRLARRNDQTASTGGRTRSILASPSKLRPPPQHAREWVGNRLVDLNYRNISCVASDWRAWPAWPSRKTWHLLEGDRLDAPRRNLQPRRWPLKRWHQMVAGQAARSGVLHKHRSVTTKQHQLWHVNTTEVLDNERKPREAHEHDMKLSKRMKSGGRKPLRPANN